MKDEIRVIAATGVKEDMLDKGLQGVKPVSRSRASGRSATVITLPTRSKPRYGRNREMPAPSHAQL